MNKLVQYITAPDVFNEDRHGFYNMVSTLDSLSTATQNQFSDHRQYLQVLLKDSDVKKRYEGLTLILKLTNNSSNDIFNSCVDTWLRSAIGFLSSKSVNLKRQSYLVIKSIIKRMTRLDPKDDTTSKILADILKTSENEEFVYCMECLATVMDKISLLNMSQTVEIEKFLIKRFGSSNHKEIEALALCMSRLPALQGSKFKEFWNNQFVKIINSLHRCFMRCKNFTDVDIQDNEDDDIQKKCVVFELPIVNSRSYSYFLQLQRHFHAISACGAKMLNTEASSVTVPGKEVLQLIDSVLSFIPSDGVFTSKVQERYLSSILPNIQIDVLLLLEALILSCHAVLSKYELPLLATVTKALSMSQEMDDVFPNHSYSRAHIYRIVETLIIRMGECTYAGHISALIHWILIDTFMIFDTLTKEPLLLNNIIKGKESGMSSSQIMRKRDNCFQALEALSAIIMLRWKEIEIKELFYSVTRLLRFLQLQSSFPPPYDDKGCRKGIYNVLFSIVSHSHLLEDALVLQAISVFECGVGDPNLKVSLMCHQAVSVCHFQYSGIKQSFASQNISDKSLSLSSSWTYFGNDCAPPTTQPSQSSNFNADVNESSAIKATKDNHVFDKKNGQFPTCSDPELEEDEFQENEESPADEENLEDDSLGEEEPLYENDASDEEMKGDDEEEDDEMGGEDEEEDDNEEYIADYDEQEIALYHEANSENHNIKLQKPIKSNDRDCKLQNGTISTEEEDNEEGDVSDDVNRKEIAVKRPAVTVCNDVSVKKKKMMEVKLDNSMEDGSDSSACDILNEDLSSMMADFVDTSPVAMLNSNS